MQVECLVKDGAALAAVPLGGKTQATAGLSSPGLETGSEEVAEASGSLEGSTPGAARERREEATGGRGASEASHGSEPSDWSRASAACCEEVRCLRAAAAAKDAQIARLEAELAELSRSCQLTLF